MIFSLLRKGEMASRLRHHFISAWDGNSHKLRHLLFWLTIFLFILIAFICIPSSPSSLGREILTTLPRSEPQAELVDREEAASIGALECFQVTHPVLTPSGMSGSSSSSQGSCEIVLMDHVFGSTYGVPFVGKYTPPSCPFNRVIITLTTVSEGYQFDRVALMYFGDTEVWRTSTVEPLPAPGVRSTYVKDMTEYLYLWNSQQDIIFDLGNVLNQNYDGFFNTTLTATFFMVDVGFGSGPPADLIIPISTRDGASNRASHFTIPAETAINTISFPRNANRAVFTISATGLANEEFWWSNVLQSKVDTFKQTTGSIPGLSPFREVQVLIDGFLASVEWPFPVIFTGGVIPSLHRPIVGLQAFDLREHQIDITPWLPLLCDGKDHTFSIRVVGVEDDDKNACRLSESVSDSWYVTGKIFVWLDAEGCITTGTFPTVESHDPSFAISHGTKKDKVGRNKALHFNMDAGRSVSVKSSISSQNKSGEVFWTQTLSYSHKAHIKGFGYNQTNDLLISSDDSMVGPDMYYKAEYEYPLYCDTTTELDHEHGSSTTLGRLTEGLTLQVEGSAVFSTGLEAFKECPGIEIAEYSGSRLKTSRHGTATFSRAKDGSYSLGSGITHQVFHFSGINDKTHKELYFRNVTAVGEAIMSDSRRTAGLPSIDLHFDTRESEESHEMNLPPQSFVTQVGPRIFMGRSQFDGMNGSKKYFPLIQGDVPEN